MSDALETERSGEYHRVCDPSWKDCSDTTYAKKFGGRWNPAGVFGALYLNESLRVAAANARRLHAGRAIGLFDLRPEQRPDLATFRVPALRVIDVVSPEGVERVGLPASYPVGADWSPCQEIARRAYGDFAGIAARSAAEIRAGANAGEELAVFDTHPLTVEARVPFAAWYPDPMPT